MGFFAVPSRVEYEAEKIVLRGNNSKMWSKLCAKGLAT